MAQAGSKILLHQLCLPPFALISLSASEVCACSEVEIGKVSRTIRRPLGNICASAAKISVMMNFIPSEEYTSQQLRRIHHVREAAVHGRKTAKELRFLPSSRLMSRREWLVQHGRAGGFLCDRALALRSSRWHWPLRPMPPQHSTTRPRTTRRRRCLFIGMARRFTATPAVSQSIHAMSSPLLAKRFMKRRRSCARSSRRSPYQSSLAARLIGPPATWPGPQVTAT